MSSPRSATSTSSSTTGETDAQRQQVLTSVTHLLTLASTPYSASRLHAVLLAHSPSLTLTKTRRLTIMTKLRHRMRDHSNSADDSSWREVESYIEQLTDSGQPIDRILSIVSYIMESSRPTNTATAHAAGVTTPLAATPPVSVPSSPAPRSPPRPSSALSVRGLMGGPSLPMTPAGVGAGSVALSAPTTMTNRASAPANPLVALSTSTMSRPLAPTVAPSPMRGIRAVMTPRVKLRQDESDERDGQTAGGRQQYRNGYIDDDTRSSLPLTTAAIAASASSLPISLLTRTAAENEMTDLCYGDQVTLQLPTATFASVDTDFLPRDTTTTTNGNTPPLLHCLSPYPFVWTIVNAKTPIDRSPVRYLDSVSFTFDHMFLSLSFSASASSSTASSASSSTVPLTLSAAPSTASRFTLYANPSGESGSSLSSLSFLSVRGSVKHSDTVILKSATGQYLSGGQDDADEASGSMVLVDRPNARSVMVLRKANLPILTADVTRVLNASDTATTTDLLGMNGASLSSLSFAEQERALVVDVLFALIGIDGQYVYRSSAESLLSSSDRRSFTVSSSVTDVSHRALLTRLTPLCDDYSVLSGYITTHGRHEYGRVQHALTATLLSLHREYTSMIASLTAQPSLSLTQLSYHLSSPASTLHHLASLLNLTRHQIGGSVLTTLHNALLLCGDAIHRQLLLSLLSSACRPYFAMLQQWLYSGVLSDSYNEFQLHSNDNVTTASTAVSAFDDSYWDSRFSLRHAQLPVFLQATADRVLTTGKYLNVIRECGRDVSVKEDERGRLVYSEQGEREYAAVVDHAYAFASRSLLSLLLSDYALLSHLSSIAHYFLFAHSDWYTQFVELAEEELERSMWAIQRERLQGLLQLAIKSARGGQAANSERLTCYLQPHSLMQKIDAMGSNKQSHGRPTRSDVAAGHIATGMDAFTLSYDVSYPLTLVLSKATMSKYQLLFRLLFNLKNAQRLLSSMWYSTLLPSAKRTRTMSSLLALRQQMSHLLSCVLDYLATQVLAPRSAALHAALQSAESLDAVIALHHAYLDDCLRLSLIVDRDVWMRLDAAVDKCKEIGRWAHDALDQEMKGGEEELLKRVEAQAAWIVESASSFEGLMCRLCVVLRDKSAMGNEAHLSLLLSRLDYNEFYRRRVQENNARHNQQPIVNR